MATANLNAIAHNFIVLVDKDMNFFTVDLSLGKLRISWKKYCVKVLSLCNICNSQYINKGFCKKVQCAK